MKNTVFKLPAFLVLAWIFAFLYEEVPRTILRDLPEVHHLWELGSGWLLFFLVWYGTLFLIAYALFIKKNIRYAVVFGLLYGIVFETFYFKKMENIFSFILFVLLYFGMFYFPFRIIKTLYDKEKIERSELLCAVITQCSALALLFSISWAS